MWFDRVLDYIGKHETGRTRQCMYHGLVRIPAMSDHAVFEASGLRRSDHETFLFYVF